VLKAALLGNMAQIYRDYYLNTMIENHLIQNLNSIVGTWKGKNILKGTETEHYFNHFALHVNLSQHFKIQTTPSA
jgi:hypothetical protein